MNKKFITSPYHYTMVNDVEIKKKLISLFSFFLHRYMFKRHHSKNMIEKYCIFKILWPFLFARQLKFHKIFT